MIHSKSKGLSNLHGKVTDGEIIKDLIKTDQSSTKKEEMVSGVNYYNTENDILQRDFRVYYINNVKMIDFNKGNEHIPNNYHKKLVDQKTGYVVGKPVTISCEDEELQQAVIDILGEKWHDTLMEWVRGSANKGFEGLHPFINNEGEFDYVLIPGEQLIFIKDTAFNSEVVNVIRYYEMELLENDVVKKSIRVELWDKEKKIFYQQVKKDFTLIQPGTINVPINPRYHWYSYNTLFVDESQLRTYDEVALSELIPHAWGRIPFISLKNNSEERSDLMVIKKYVDALDIIASGFLNDFKDIQLAIWVLKGYEGTDLGEFMMNLMKFKAIKISADKDMDSSVEAKTLEIPKEARVAMMDWCERQIYKIGQGVDESKISGGSITNVVIKAMYAGLDLKADQTIVKMKTALQELMYFVVEYINMTQNKSYDYKMLKFSFDKSLIFNRSEIVTDIKNSGSDMSLRTRLEKNPYIDDVDLELERLEEEDQAALEKFTNDPRFNMNDDEGEKDGNEEIEVDENGDEIKKKDKIKDED